jgi:hypothetical protein
MSLSSPLRNSIDLGKLCIFSVSSLFWQLGKKHRSPSCDIF